MTDEQFNQILRQTLAPEIPDERMNQNLKRAMEEKEMKKNEKSIWGVKKAVLLTAACCLLVGSIAVASSGEIISLVSGGNRQGYESFQMLDEARERAGFTFHALEQFQNGYTFSEMNVYDTNGLDEEGNVLETYKDVSLYYEKTGEDNLTITVMEAMYAHDENQRKADRTVTIEGLEAAYYVDTYKCVPTDYELTEEDKTNMEREDYYISYGADAVSENQVSYVIWVQDGIRYCIMNVMGATSPETMFGMAEELILQ
jgi:hypothetical protein